MNALTAISNNDIEKVRLLIQSKNIQWSFCYQYNGYSALQCAIALNRPNIAKMLINASADINFQRKETFSTAVHITIAYKNIEILSLLLEKKADLSLRDNKKQTPLELAVYQSSLEIVEILVKASAYKYNTEIELQQMLSFAVDNKNYDLTKIMLESGVNINFSYNASPKNNVYLWEAVTKEPFFTKVLESKNIELIKLFINHGLDFYFAEAGIMKFIQNAYGKTDLLHEVKVGSENLISNVIANLLITAGIVYYSKENIVKIYTLAKKHEDFDLINRIITLRPEIELNDFELLELIRKTYAEYSIQVEEQKSENLNKNDKDNILAILANININFLENKQGQVLLDLIIKSQDSNFIAKLIEHTKNSSRLKNVTKANLVTNLKVGDTKLFAELLDDIKDINSITFKTKQDKLIHLAVFYNKIETVELLISKGIKIGVRNSENDTALMISVQNNNTEIAKLLLKNNAISYQNVFEVGDIFKLVIENDNYALAESIVSHRVNISQLIGTKNGDFSEDYKLYESKITLLKFSILKKSTKFIDFLFKHGAVKEPVQNFIENIIKKPSQRLEDEKHDSESLKLEQERNYELIKFLHNKKFEINIEALLYDSVKKSNIDYTKLFINLGANLNFVKREYSVLMIAINSGNKEIVELLIDAKVDTNYNSTVENIVTIQHSLQIDYNNVTPLHLAIHKGNISIVVALIDGEADINHIYTIQQYRISNSGNYFAEGPEIKTPLLSLAIESNQLEIAKHMILAGANLYPKGVKNNQAPLFKALQLNNDEMMLFILEYKVDKESIEEIKKQIFNDIPKQEWFEKILQEAKDSRDKSNKDVISKFLIDLRTKIKCVVNELPQDTIEIISGYASSGFSTKLSQAYYDNYLKYELDIDLIGE